MIERVTIKNFRNLSGIFDFSSSLNIVVGKNGSGKTNLVDAIRLAFSKFDDDMYYRVQKSDFTNGDDSAPIEISILLKKDSMPRLSFLEYDGSTACGFKMIVRKYGKDRYRREVKLYDGNHVDIEQVENDVDNIPKLCVVPLVRIEDIYNPGLRVGLKELMVSDERYKDIMKKSKEVIKDDIKQLSTRFNNLVGKFGKNLTFDPTDPNISKERLNVIDADPLHADFASSIGSGYQSIANILLNALDEKFKIVLIDEIENHLHPALLRNLLNEIREQDSMLVVATTHSPVAINEVGIREIISMDGRSHGVDVENQSSKRLDKFLNPGRAELIFADNVILVEGYTEEMLIRYHITKNRLNWTVVNVAGIMFEPYIDICIALNKTTVVMSDNDVSKNGGRPTSRFNNLKSICEGNNIPIIEIDNTLESDLYKNGYLDSLDKSKYLKNESGHYVVKDSRYKTEIAAKLIENNCDFGTWWAVKEISKIFASNEVNGEPVVSD